MRVKQFKKRRKQELEVRKRISGHIGVTWAERTKMIMMNETRCSSIIPVHLSTDHDLTSSEAFNKNFAFIIL